MNEQESKLKSVSDFMSSLTLSRVGLFLLVCAGAMVLYALYESRTSWAPMLWQSPTTIVTFGILVTVIAGGAAINSLQARLDQRTDSLYRQMRDQIEDMQKAISEAAADRRTMSDQIALLTAAERECQQRLMLLRKELETYAGGRRATDTIPGGL